MMPGDLSPLGQQTRVTYPPYLLTCKNRLRIANERAKSFVSVIHKQTQGGRRLSVTGSRAGSEGSKEAAFMINKYWTLTPRMSFHFLDADRTKFMLKTLR